MSRSASESRQAPTNVGDVRLEGGFYEGALRRGNVVLKRAPKDPEFVARLLQLLERVGADFAPRWLGIQRDGRGAYSFIPGHVPWSRPGPEPRGVYGGAGRRRVFRLIRQLHDLTAGTALAGGHEVVCHGDLAYFNTVYQPTKAGTYLPVAFIDWDLARPGTRLEDVAHAIWQFLSLGDPGTDAWVDLHPGLIAECCAIYGLEDRSGLIDAIVYEQRRTVDGMREALAAGQLSRQLAETDAMAKVQRMLDWTVEHRQLYASKL